MSRVTGVGGESAVGCSDAAMLDARHCLSDLSVPRSAVTLSTPLLEGSLCSYNTLPLHHNVFHSLIVLRHIAVLT